MRSAAVIWSFMVAALASTAASQTPVDSALNRYIATIKMVDNHAHPGRVRLPGMGPDTEFDALPLSGFPVPLPLGLRPESPAWIPVWKSFYGYPYSDMDSAHLLVLAAARHQAMQTHGVDFPTWVLDQAGIDIMFANRVAMGPGLVPERFRWVAFVDPLMYPLDTRGEASTPDTKVLFPLTAKLLRRYERESGVTSLPATLDAYLRTVVTATMERMRKGGAVAVKFEAGYLRPLDFAAASAGDARATYARYVSGGAPDHASYKNLQDYLFKYIAREAGRLGMAVHIHIIAGLGSYYPIAGSEPYQLEPTFNDPELRGTTFVFLHGGWPLTNQTMALLNKPNVYADISLMDQFMPPTQLAAVLRAWLEIYPEKVLFGSDAFGGDPDGGLWEDGAWLATTNARRALAIALSGMMADGEVDRPGAERLARMVLRENAMGLYRLGRVLDPIREVH
jgi:predicted TIM-barrel fold metal-dependent hydrolase